MDYDKLIERFRYDAADWGGDPHIKRDLLDAATAIETFRGEIAKLKDSRDRWKKCAENFSAGVEQRDREYDALQEENEKLRADLDRAAQERLTAEGVLLPCPGCKREEADEKRETAINWLKEEIRSLRRAPEINGCGPENWADLLEIMETCLEAVKNHFHDLTKMVPLTLEQLREMDGKPVWIVEAPYWGNWELSEDAEDYIIDRHEEFYGLKYNDPEGKFGLHKLGWIAYAYPPAHIDREAWEPCEECEERNCDNCLFCEYLSGMEPCKSCYSAKKWKPISRFCSECGRPLTEEAWAELEKRLGG